MSKLKGVIGDEKPKGMIKWPRSRNENLNASRNKHADNEEALKLKRNKWFHFSAKPCNKWAEKKKILHANF